MRKALEVPHLPPLLAPLWSGLISGHFLNPSVGFDLWLWPQVLISYSGSSVSETEPSLTTFLVWRCSGTAHLPWQAPVLEIAWPSEAALRAAF